jgi:hypothetical protein
LLLWHRARTSQDSALQCDATPYGRMDCAPTTGGISGTSLREATSHRSDRSARARIPNPRRNEGRIRHQELHPV